jgi:hypothetical protein
VAGGLGTHPPGWVRCHHPPATSDPFRTADQTGFYVARIVRELRSRIMRARRRAAFGGPHRVQARTSVSQSAEAASPERRHFRGDRTRIGRRHAKEGVPDYTTPGRGLHGDKDPFGLAAIKNGHPFSTRQRPKHVFQPIRQIPDRCIHPLPPAVWKPATKSRRKTAPAPDHGIPGLPPGTPLSHALRCLVRREMGREISVVRSLGLVLS